MSIVHRAWAIVTGFYLVTLVACVLVITSQLASRVQPDLSARSTLAVQTAAALLKEVDGDAPSALESFAAQLRAAAPLEGWSRVEVRDKTGALVARIEPQTASASAELVDGWFGTSAELPLTWKQAPFGDLRVWVAAPDTVSLVRRCVLAVVTLFVVLGGAMIYALSRLAAWARSPLEGFEAQIAGLSERRFVSLQQPQVPEWVALSKSLNVMVARVRQMLDERDRAVGDLEGRLAHDELTHTASRPMFMQTLSAALKDSVDGGSVAIVRVHDLEGMNRRVGRGRTDEFLVSVATTIRTRLMLAGEADAMLVARLNGADFGLLVPGGDLDHWRTRLQQLADGLAALADDGLSDGPHVAWIGGTTFRQGETPSEVLLRLDTMVIAAEAQWLPVCVTEPSARRHAIAVAQWRVLIETALDTGRFTLGYVPVVDLQGRLLHREAMLRLVDPDGQWLEAQDLVPPAIRNGRIAHVDLRAIELALAALAESTGAIAVNVAWQSLRRPFFLRSLGTLLERHAGVASRLCLEVDEQGYTGLSLQPAQALSRLVSPYGCRLGIDHFGVTLSMLPVLHQVPVSYVKLSPRLLPGLVDGPRVRGLISTLTAVCRPLGTAVLCNGVSTAAERELLRGLGVTGYSEPDVVTVSAPADASPDATDAVSAGVAA